MMKRLVSLSLLLAFMAGCGDQKNGNETSDPYYPTTTLKLEREMRVMLTQLVSPTSPLTALNTIITAQVDYELGASKTALGLPSQALGGNPWADTIAAQLMLSQPSPALAVNMTPVGQSELEAVPELAGMASNGNPVASVRHRVREDDTSWVVYNKVKFWKDTLGNEFRIATYLLYDIPAVRYQSQSLDLRYLQVDDLINRGDSLSTWAADVPNADSTATVIGQGDIFTYRSVMVSPFGHRSFGIPILDYTVFGPRFFRNDIYGTESTPIEHHFVKPEAFETDTIEANFNYEPAFLSVIWAVQDSMGTIQKAEYVNSYMSRP
jgi:hypothetical protein